MSDFVFKNTEAGLEFVGDFDGLYGYVDDPWEQSGASGDKVEYYSKSRRALVELVQQLPVYDLFAGGMEVGCGHGHVTEILRRNCALYTWTGVDISSLAIEEARSKYIRCAFMLGDITRKGYCYLKQDVVILNELLWYILHKIDAVVDNCYALLVSNGHLIINQAFLSRQLYGTEIVDGAEGLLQLFARRYAAKFELMYSNVEQSNTGGLYNGLFLFKKV